MITAQCCRLAGSWLWENDLAYCRAYPHARLFICLIHSQPNLTIFGGHVQQQAYSLTDMTVVGFQNSFPLRNGWAAKLRLDFLPVNKLGWVHLTSRHAQWCKISWTFHGYFTEAFIDNVSGISIGPCSAKQIRQLSDCGQFHNLNKKAVVSQRWPHDVPLYECPESFWMCIENLPFLR